MALILSRKERTFVPVWQGNDQLPEGEQIQLDPHTLTVGDMFALQRETGVNLLGGLEVDIQNVEAMEQYWKMLQAVLGDYTSNYKNIEVDGVEVTEPGKVLELLQVNHMELLAEIFNYVIAQSTGSNAEAKNSDTPSEPTKEESVTTAQAA